MFHGNWMQERTVEKDSGMNRCCARCSTYISFQNYLLKIRLGLLLTLLTRFRLTESILFSVLTLLVVFCRLFTHNCNNSRYYFNIIYSCNNNEENRLSLTCFLVISPSLRKINEHAFSLYTWNPDLLKTFVASSFIFYYFTCAEWSTMINSHDSSMARWIWIVAVWTINRRPWTGCVIYTHMVNSFSPSDPSSRTVGTYRIRMRITCFVIGVMRFRRSNEQNQISTRQINNNHYNKTLQGRRVLLILYSETCLGISRREPTK